MITTLKVNAKEFTIVQVYPYQYNYGEGKEVLRVKVSKDNHSYIELENEFTNIATDIEHYEDGILVNKYVGYKRDFKCNYANNEFEVEITRLTATEREVMSLKEVLFPTIDRTNLETHKASLITVSKTKLAEYLEKNPLLFSDGKYYSVLSDKQNLLNNAISIYQLKIQMGYVNPELKWNATGKECTAWTIENLITLALAIAEYVEPLVSKQQTLETQINLCTTQAELDTIVIDYSII